MRKMKMGLALGSGAARGMAHIGVLRALEENNVNIDIISGTSIGAVVGMLYASGLSVDGIEKFASKFGRRNIAFWMDPSFFRGGGFLKGDKIEQALEESAGAIDFSELKIPFYAVASDLITGKEVVISKGSVCRAVRASLAIPGIFSPVKYNERWLVDGALVTPVPTRVLRENGCDLIIAVNVCAEPEREDLIGSDSGPKIFDVLMQALSVIQQKITEPCMKMADISIVPAVGEYSWTDFSHFEDLIEAGYKATIDLMPGIKQLISRKRKLLFFKRLFTTTLRPSFC